MKMNKQLENKLKKFATLAVKVGINILPGQGLEINTSVEAAEFARMIVEAAYEQGAGAVDVIYGDSYVSKLFFEHGSDKYLENVPDWEVAKRQYMIDDQVATLAIVSPNPTIYKDVDPAKMAKYSKAQAAKLSFYRKFKMASGTQWSIVAWPNPVWAKTVFPNDEESVAMEKLLDAILYASRVSDDFDVIEEWTNHMNKLEAHSKILNEYNFKTLKFKNSLGTDLSIDLVKNHIWAGGAEMSLNGVKFAPNIPTEEVFTMPDKNHINGRVVSTKPLNYQGKLIENFYLDFVDGKVVNYYAEKEQETLKYLLEMDEGSKSLGEVALISYDSPISKQNILFYNTLFDENASCHLALGNAYTMNILDGNNMPEEELLAKGFNKSMVHVDFMFGSSDMKIDGIKENGEVVAIFRKGNFVF